MSSLLQNLIDEPYNMLLADTDFINAEGTRMVVFISEDDGDIDTKIDTELARGTGLVCVLGLVDGVCDAPDAYPVVLSPVRLVAEISENVTMSRSDDGEAGTDYLTLRMALAMVLDKLQLFAYSSGAALGLPNKKPAFQRVDPMPGADGTYQIYLETSETLENTRD